VVAETNIAKKQFPFMKFSAAPLFGQTVKSLAGQLASRVCKTKGLTIASFCALARDVAGFPMCAGSTIDTSSFVVLLQYVATPITSHAGFVYDYAAYGPSDLKSGGATQAIGMDANFDLVTKPTGTIEFLMELDKTPEFVLG